MTIDARCGTLVLLLDLEEEQGSGPASCDEPSLATVDALLAVLRDARMAGTWASSTPATCHAVTDILAETVGHEIALRAASDSHGLPGTSRRTRLYAQQLEKAKRAGYPITTLVCDCAPHAEMLQAICRLGLTAVASQGAISPPGPWNWLKGLQELMWRNESEPPQPRLLRYGLWELPAAVRLPGASAGAVRRALEAAAACFEVLHVVIHVPQLKQGRAGGLKLVEGLLQTAFNLRSERRLAVRTAADLANRLRADRTSTPARSILRRAA